MNFPVENLPLSHVFCNFATIFNIQLPLSVRNGLYPYSKYGPEKKTSITLNTQKMMNRQVTIMRPMKKVLSVAAVTLLAGCSASKTTSFQTRYLGLDINDKGYIVGMRNITRE